MPNLVEHQLNSDNLTESFGQNKTQPTSVNKTAESVINDDGGVADSKNANLKSKIVNDKLESDNLAEFIDQIKTYPASVNETAVSVIDDDGGLM